VERLLGEVEHVRAVERLAGLGELLFAGGEQAVDPREQLLRAVVGIEDDGHAVGLGRGVHVMRAGDAAEDGTVLVFLRDVFADEELGPAIRELDHGRRVDLAGGGERGVDGAGADAIDRRQGEFVGLGVIEQFFNFVTKRTPERNRFVEDILSVIANRGVGTRGKCPRGGILGVEEVEPPRRGEGSERAFEASTRRICTFTQGAV